MSLNHAPLAESTIRTYQKSLAQWYDFSGTDEKKKWSERDFVACVIDYIDSQHARNISPYTVRRDLSALRWMFGAMANSPEIRNRLTVFEYQNGRPQKKAIPMGVDELKAIVGVTDKLRDRTLLCVGWCGALRGAELVAIRRCDLTKHTEGYELMIPRSKTDQKGQGKTIAIPYYHPSHMAICPARHLDVYLVRQMELFTEITEDDYIFPITTRTLSRVIKRGAKNAYLMSDYSTHSLRRGLATTAASHGIEDRTIQRHTRLKSRQVLDRYIDDGTLWIRTAVDFLR